ncbi:MAG: MerR family transcriptional regulator [Acidimicrobiia bacterium]|nr:MAG: MerR family transcriptional regulator [Acidimicrobiia bacterium]
MKAAARIGIGEAAEALKSEFPDVTVSKIRFLEAEGLINPPRTRSGYREFGPEDLERIRYVLRQQRDHFLPLRVIKAKMTAWERGESTAPAPAAGPPAGAYFASDGRNLGASEAAEAAGVPETLVRQLLEHGVLVAPQGGAAAFDSDDVAVLRAAYRMVGHGLEARHLRTIRLGANREVDLFRQLAGPMLRHATPAARRQAAEMLADVAQAAREMQEAMVRADLRETLGR